MTFAMNLAMSPKEAIVARAASQEQPIGASCRICSAKTKNQTDHQHQGRHHRHGHGDVEQARPARTRA